MGIRMARWIWALSRVQISEGSKWLVNRSHGLPSKKIKRVLQCWGWYTGKVEFHPLLHLWIFWTFSALWLFANLTCNGESHMTEPTKKSHLYKRTLIYWQRFWGVLEWTDHNRWRQVAWESEQLHVCVSFSWFQIYNKINTTYHQRLTAF